MENDDTELSAVIRIKSIALATAPEVDGDELMDDDSGRVPVVGKLRVEQDGSVTGRYGFRGWAEAADATVSDDSLGNPSYEVVLRAQVGRFNLDLTLETELAPLLAELARGTVAGLDRGIRSNEEVDDLHSTADMPAPLERPTLEVVPDTATWDAVWSSEHPAVETPIGGVPQAAERAKTKTKTKTKTDS